MNVNVALVQMNIALGDKTTNIERARYFTRGLRGTELILLPELWSTGYDLTRARELAETMDGKALGFMVEAAKETGAFVGGSILSARRESVYNTFFLVDPEGKVAATYDKAHLFRLMQEDVYLAPGAAFSSVDMGFAKAGLSICYDLRFPEIFRHYADKPVDMMLLVAEWPLPRLEHWRTLIRARAIENQCFVVACNRVGTDSANTFFGHSMVVDPWGDVLVEGDDSEQTLTAHLNLSTIEAARKRIPVLTDRRKDLYR